eukprot:3301240-Pyramimonas_sp.AAC.1
MPPLLQSAGFLQIDEVEMTARDGRSVAPLLGPSGICSLVPCDWFQPLEYALYSPVIGAIAGAPHPLEVGVLGNGWHKNADGFIHRILCNIFRILVDYNRAVA